MRTVRVPALAPDGPHGGPYEDHPRGPDQTSQTDTACLSPASGSRVGMNSWPT